MYFKEKYVKKKIKENGGSWCPIIEGTLDLNNWKTFPKGFNPIVGGSLWLKGVKKLPKGFSPTVGGELHLDELTQLPEGFSPTVGYNLWLNRITKLPKDFNPIVGVSLILNGLKSVPRGFNPVVGGSLLLNGLKSIPEGFNPIVGDCLALDGLKSIPEDFNPVVGGSLSLDGLESIPEGFNPVVGGSLSLNGLKSISKDFNPTVGVYLYIKGVKNNKIKPLENGDYVPGQYLYADYILTHVKCEKKFGKYTYYVGKIPGQNVIFDGTNYAHCKNFREGVAELAFKAAVDRGAERYRSLKLDSEVNKSEAILMYRIITGACQQGTERFVSGLKDIKDKYTIQEIINLTDGQYGSEAFRKFFVR